MKNNEVMLKGKILYIYTTPNKGNVLVKVGCKGNVVQCFICNEMLKEHFKEFNVGDYINLTGNVQSTKRNEVISYTVFVESIIPPEYTDKAYYNQFWLEGTTAAVCELTNCLRITIHTESEGRYSFVPVVFYYPDIRRLNFEVGERIHTQGSIQSVRKKDADGEYIYFQNYVGNISKTG